MRFIDCGVVGSTFDAARSYANAGDFGPLWVRADAQSAGRGRRGRAWESSKGNLFCTGLYPHAMTASEAGRLSFAASLAVFDLVGAYIDAPLITLKWPNDVLINGAKTSGILLENGHTNGQPWIMIGIGVNLVSAPDIPDYSTTYILRHMDENALAGPEPLMTGPEAALAILARRFDHWLNIYLSQGFGPLRAAWLSRAPGIPGPVTVQLNTETFSGDAVTLGEQGELQVRLPNGTMRDIHAGDVYFGNTANGELNASGN